MAIGRKVSPGKFLGAITGVVGGISNLIGGNKAAAAARRQQAIAQAEMRQRKAAYEGLDTSNLYADVENQYAGMENVMEDLTVNQQQAQFEAQQGAQQRANIMQGLQGAAGGSGIAALAQQMASQGQLATQRASASIGQQEAANRRAERSMAGQIQLQERAGEAAAEQLRLKGADTARGLERQKVTNLLGMASGQLQAANAAKAAADKQKAAGISGIIGGVASGLAGGLGGGLLDKAKGLFGGGGAATGAAGGLGLGGGGFGDPGFGMSIGGGITGPTIDQFGNTQFKDLSNLKIQ